MVSKPILLFFLTEKKKATKSSRTQPQNLFLFFSTNMFRSIFNVKPSIRHLTTEAVGGQWVPKKRVSRPTMEKIRALAATVSIK
jgi:hypothetical protein